MKPIERMPYGLWPSPITPVSLARGLRLRDVCWDSDGRTLVWLEERSDRGVLATAPADGAAPRDLTEEHSVRARVGYGGGDFSAGHGHAYYVSGGRIYKQPLAEGAARPVTPAYGEPVAPTLSPDGRWLLYVHSAEEIDGLAIVDAEGSLWPQKLAYGDDFYMQPTWHPDSQRIAWVSWNHPQMPWDGTTLTLGELAIAGQGLPRLARAQTLAGGKRVMAFQPAFSPDGRYLAYIADPDGWDALYLHDLEAGTVRALVTEQVELSEPAWAQGMRTFSWSPDGGGIYYTRNEHGWRRLWRVSVPDGASEPVAELAEYGVISQLTVSSRGSFACIASAPRIPPRIVVWEPKSAPRVVRRSQAESVPEALLSEPQPVSWPSDEGDAVHGLYYPPREGIEGVGLPPLVVMVHGGPTGQALARYEAGVQFLTTRGYAVLAVNYRGSTGYGRAYRERLNGRWGQVDADDTVAGARYLAGQGLADPYRLVVMGGSAGGYTVLQSLIRYPGTFKAGVCLYGVTNLFTLAADTHKFEQRYLDTLVGPLPEAAQRYRDHSPLWHCERIVDPVAIFQGEEDRVVPKEQAEEIVKALRRNGVPHEYHLYPGEGHGWRRAETVEAFHRSLLAFLRQYVLYA